MSTKSTPAAMSGHHPDGSSVQRHSAGPTYPYIVIGLGDGAGVLHPDGTCTRAYPRRPRDRAGRLAAWADARERATRLAERHMLTHGEA